MNCNKCENGMIRIRDGYNRCECQREKITKKLFNQSGTPERFYKKKNELDDQTVFNPKHETLGYLKLIDSLTDPAKVSAMIEREMKIILIGNSGSGKTQLASTVAIEILSQFDLYQPNIEPNRLFFLDVRTIGNFMFDTEQKLNVLKKVKKANILIVDDLGTEQYTTAAILNMLDEIMRSFNGLTIITTNKKKEIKKVKDEKGKFIEISNEIKDIYNQYNSRLSDVLIPAKEEKHGILNVLYYYIVTPIEQSNRQTKIDDLKFF